MKLLTDGLRARLLAAGAGEEPSGERDDAECIVKFFDPCGRYTYYVFSAVEVECYQAEPDLILFGYVVSPLDASCDEWGTALFAEIENATNWLGLPMERDLHFDAHLTVAQINNGELP